VDIRSSITVKMALESEDANRPTRCHLTPLSWAVKSEQEAVVGMAISKGHEEAVEMLLERRDVGPNISYPCRETLLLSAITTHQEAVVKMLLERNDANLNTVGINGD